ncbi:MAG: hypothetical protein QOG54_2076 [Actinomycetota bacterium]|jgi:hypothetical protein|nr:hypothetical protein [Actinomycetota bacterium]
MGLRRIAADLREVQTNLSELLSENTEEEKAASKQLADSARTFSRRTRAVVDDKLTFSATLMRAGEVNAANRLLREVEDEVRSEEAALIEVVNEVKVASSIRRERITRLRLARALVASLLGFCLLAFSAVGMAVAGVFNSTEHPVNLAPYDGSIRHPGKALRDVAADNSNMRRLKIADMNLLVTASQFRRIIKLTDGTVDDHSLSDLMNFLPDALAQKIQHAIDTANGVVATVEEVVPVAVDPRPIQGFHKAAEKEADEASDEADAASEDAGTSKQDASERQADGTEDQRKGGDGSDDDGDESETPPTPQSVPPIRP